MFDSSFAPITCCACSVVFYVPEYVHATLKESSQLFYCPHGHKQHFLSKEEISERDALRQERDRLKQRIAQKDDAILAERKRGDSYRDQRDHERRRVSAAKGQVTKLKKRASAGVCPCCTRHFTDLERHMASKHPDFAAQPDAADNVVPLKRA